MICKECGKEYYGKTSKWCSNSCYQKYYYKENKDKISKRHKERYLKTYVPHPKPLVPEEEKKAKRKKYYQDNREYYIQKSREYHQKHKHEEEYKKRKNENLKRYLKRRKERENANKKV